MAVVFQHSYHPEPAIVTLTGPGTYACAVISEASDRDTLKAICGPVTEDEGAACIVEALCHRGYVLAPRYHAAIQVEIQKKIVGYLNEKDARKLGKWLGERGKSAAVCSALIKGGATYVRGQGEARALEHVPYTVWLDLP